MSYLWKQFLQYFFERRESEPKKMIAFMIIGHGSINTHHIRGVYEPEIYESPEDLDLHIQTWAAPTEVCKYPAEEMDEIKNYAKNSFDKLQDELENNVDPVSTISDVFTHAEEKVIRILYRDWAHRTKYSKMPQRTQLTSNGVYVNKSYSFHFDEELSSIIEPGIFLLYSSSDGRFNKNFFGNTKKAVNLLDFLKNSEGESLRDEVKKGKNIELQTIIHGCKMKGYDFIYGLDATCSVMIDHKTGGPILGNTTSTRSVARLATKAITPAKSNRSYKIKKTSSITRNSSGGSIRKTKKMVNTYR
jgi:hypothetical protein